MHNDDKTADIIRANTSPRYQRLEALESWVAGTQYAGRKPWFDDSVPLWERAPVIVYPVVQIAVNSFVDLLLGEGRFPAFSTKPDEDDDGDEDGLDEEPSLVVDKFLIKHHERCKFRAYAREALASAMGCGTTVGVHGVRGGKPFADALPAKWCTPEFDGDRNVIALDIRYPYVEEFKDRDGKWKRRVKLYRRRLDESTDTTYYPADAREDGTEPSWSADPAQTFAHGLGFCPVVWYPFVRGTAPINQIDGHAIHEFILDEIQAHDIARSQWHRCSLLSEPQLYETGVEPGFNPTEIGRKDDVPAYSEVDGRVVGQYRCGPSREPARKKGPGYVWQYPNPDSRVDAVTIGADALAAQKDNCSDLRVKLQESMCVVFLDPENIKFAATTSGKALEAIKQKQIDRCDQYRDDLRDNFLLPSVSMQLRIAQRVGAGLRVPGVNNALPVLKKFATNEAADAA
jgi:hypothetical protein